MTTTQTHNNNNGESSSSSKSKPKTTKPPKPTKEKAEESTGTGTGGNKAKSAKELKKEKRAALVAAREGGGGEGGERASDVPTGTGNNSDKIDRNDKVIINGTPHPRNNHPLPNAQIQNHSQSQHVAAQESFYSHVTTHKTPNTLEASTSGKIHPIVVRLGVLMANGAMRGANSRTMGMMAAFQQVIRDYKTPENAVMWKDLMSHLSPMITYLEGCRPKGTGGGNAIRCVPSYT
jgi:translation initiation factor eIF-2B subunit delta